MNDGHLVYHSGMFAFTFNYYQFITITVAKLRIEE
tara:strand:+ start:3101 stop:3205 length:105 start_codon:yes stop_codon:yes gene_type:complete